MAISSLIDTSRVGKMSYLERVSFSWEPASVDESVRLRIVENIRRREDSVHISEAGMRLLIDGKKAGANSWERVASGSSDELLNALDNAVSKSGKLLEQMKDLAASAKDKSLDDEARIKLQIEMGRLTHEINAATSDVSRIMAKQSGITNPLVSVPSFFESNEYGMLSRAYDRILGGEEWDVAEQKCPILEFVSRGTTVEGDGEWLETGAYVWETTDDPNIPTVGEILKTTSISVMDQKAAAVSENDLKKGIKKLAAFRRDLIAYVERSGENPEDSYAGEKLFSKANDFVNIIMPSLIKRENKMLVENHGAPKRKDEEGNIVSFEKFKPNPPKIMTSLPESEAFFESGNAPIRSIPEINLEKRPSGPANIGANAVYPYA